MNRISTIPNPKLKRFSIKRVGAIVGIGDGKVLGTNNGLIGDNALGDALCDPLGITPASNPP